VEAGMSAQLDADVAYYEPLIQQLEEESGSRLELLNRMTDKCIELRTSIEQAKTEVARERDKEEIDFLDKIVHMPFFEFCLQVKERKQSLQSKWGQKK
jgi:hypothetical protein